MEEINIENNVINRGTLAPNYSPTYDPLNNKIIYGNNTLDHTGPKGLDGTATRGTPLGRYGYGSVVFQIIVTFVIGLVFAPFSYGFIYFLLFWFFWVLLYSLTVNFQFPMWRVFTLFGIFMVGVLGFIIGRIMIGDENILKWKYDD